MTRLYICMTQKPFKPVKMISFNIPWALLNRIDHYCHENQLRSRTQFLIEAAEEALERSDDPRPEHSVDDGR